MALLRDGKLLTYDIELDDFVELTLDRLDRMEDAMHVAGRMRLEMIEVLDRQAAQMNAMGYTWRMFKEIADEK